LCGMGVTSVIDLTSKPAPCIERIAASRPGPGPFTKMSTSRTPISSARLETLCAAICAAYGVLLLDPLNGGVSEPGLPHRITLPSGSVNVIRVLLNVAWMYTRARGTAFRSRRRPALLLPRLACGILPPTNSSHHKPGTCWPVQLITSWHVRAGVREPSSSVHAWSGHSCVYAGLARASCDGGADHDTSQSPSTA
jgi:hypothetical protein